MLRSQTVSLKAFHVIFVTVSTILAFGVGFWAMRDYFTRHESGSLVFGLTSLLGAVVLVIYGRWFLKKLKGVSYL